MFKIVMSEPFFFSVSVFMNCVRLVNDDAINIWRLGGELLRSRLQSSLYAKYS